MVKTPGKRPGRTGSKVRTPSKSPGVDPLDIDDNDDWAEMRRNKQERKDAALARTASLASPYHKKSAAVAGTKGLNEQGILDLYSACIKLNADNVSPRSRSCLGRLASSLICPLRVTHRKLTRRTHGTSTSSTTWKTWSCQRPM